MKKENSFQTEQPIDEIARLLKQVDDSGDRQRLKDKLAHINMLTRELHVKTDDMMKIINGSNGTATQELFSMTVIASIIGYDVDRRLSSLAVFMGGANEIQEGYV